MFNLFSLAYMFNVFIVGFKNADFYKYLWCTELKRTHTFIHRVAAEIHFSPWFMRSTLSCISVIIHTISVHFCLDSFLEMIYEIYSIKVNIDCMYSDVYAVLGWCPNMGNIMLDTSTTLYIITNYITSHISSSTANHTGTDIIRFRKVTEEEQSFVGRMNYVWHSRTIIY